MTITLKPAILTSGRGRTQYQYDNEVAKQACKYAVSVKNKVDKAL